MKIKKNARWGGEGEGKEAQETLFYFGISASRSRNKIFISRNVALSTKVHTEITQSFWLHPLERILFSSSYNVFIIFVFQVFK